LVRCVLEFRCGWVGEPATRTLLNPAAPNLQHTTNREQNDRCGNSTAQSQAPDMDILMSETC